MPIHLGKLVLVFLIDDGERTNAGRDRVLVVGVPPEHVRLQVAAGKVEEQQSVVVVVERVVEQGQAFFQDHVGLLKEFVVGEDAVFAGTVILLETRRGEKPETLGSLVRAAIACQDLAVALGTPFISGKDSLNNEFRFTQADGTKQSMAIPSSLLISAMGQVADVGHCTTMDLKEAGNFLYQVGATKEELGGSHFTLVNNLTGGQVPQVDAVLSDLRRIAQRFPNDARVEERGAALVHNVVPILDRIADQYAGQVNKVTDQMRRLPSYQINWPTVRDIMRDMEDKYLFLRRVAQKCLAHVTNDDSRRELHRLISHCDRKIDQCHSLGE